MDLKIGDVFSTPFEEGCVVTGKLWSFSTSKAKGSQFTALDSDGVECQFSTLMVIGHPDFRMPYSY